MPSKLINLGHSRKSSIFKFEATISVSSKDLIPGNSNRKYSKSTIFSDIKSIGSGNVLIYNLRKFGGKAILVIS